MLLFVPLPGVLLIEKLTCCEFGPNSQQVSEADGESQVIVLNDESLNKVLWLLLFWEVFYVRKVSFRILKSSDYNVRYIIYISGEPCMSSAIEYWLEVNAQIVDA